MYHKTIESLMDALGYDRTYASKLRERHNIVFRKGKSGYSESKARAALALAGIDPPKAQSYAGSEDAAEEYALPGICSYDDAVEKGYSLANAIKRERAIAAEIANEEARERLRTLRGELVPKDQVRAKVEKVTLACIEAIGTLPDLYAESLPADQRAEGRKLARGWVEAVRQRMADALNRG